LDSLTPFLLYFESENMLEKFNSKVLNVWLSNSHFPQSIQCKWGSFMALKRQILIHCYVKNGNGNDCFEIVYAHKKWGGKLMWLFTHLRFELQHFCFLMENTCDREPGLSYFSTFSGLAGFGAKLFVYLFVWHSG
jgi:hypothetical protein